MVIKRGDIFYADLRPVIGSEQGKIANSCGARCQQMQYCEEFGYFIRAATHD